jgi:serine/threonine protein kinase/outer membrane protein assembly factor BamB
MSREADFLTENLFNQPIMFLKIGTIVIDRYVIEKVLGSGGMGNVYLATDKTIPNGRPCAIKETPTPADDPPTREQYVRIRALQMEADIMSKLHHPAIPRVFDFFPWQRRHYLVMDHIDGQTLSDRLVTQITEHGTGFDEPTVIGWALLICDLFDYLHTQNPPVIHRDIKPENFILTPQNDLRMIDYGIARRLTGGQRITELGSQGYAPPESYHGTGDPRTDIYSLGAMMHALLTGKDPRHVPLFAWDQHRARKYRPALSQEIDDIIMRCLQTEMRDRWKSARELREALITLRQFLQRSQPGQEPPRVGRVATPSNPSGTIPRETYRPPDVADVEGDLRDIPALAPPIAWVFEAQGAIRSSPAVRDDLVYFGAHDAHLYALSLRDGRQQGAFAVNGNVCSDPIVTERSVLFGAEDGHMYALNRSLTRKQWSYPIGKPIVATPALCGDLVIIGANDGQVYAFPLTGGEPRWRFETWGPVRGTLGAFGEQIVFGSQDQRIYALNVEGRRLWHCTTRDKVEAPPIVRRGVIYIGGMDQHLYALDQEHGTLLWKRRLEGCILTAAAARDGRIYAGSADGRIICLDARNGETRWRYNVHSQITSDLVLRDQRLYFGCADGGMYCLDGHRQEVCWRHQAGGAIVTRPALVNGLVIIGSVDHRVYALHDTSAAAQEA